MKKIYDDLHSLCMYMQIFPIEHCPKVGAKKGFGD